MMKKTARLLIVSQPWITIWQKNKSSSEPILYVPSYLFNVVDTMFWYFNSSHLKSWFEVLPRIIPNPLKFNHPSGGATPLLDRKLRRACIFIWLLVHDVSTRKLDLYNFAMRKTTTLNSTIISTWTKGYTWGWLLQKGSKVGSLYWWAPLFMKASILSWEFDNVCSQCMAPLVFDDMPLFCDDQSLLVNQTDFP